MDAAGNLLDCIVMTVRAALYNTRIPKTEIQDLGEGEYEFEVMDDVEDAEPIVGWENLPITVTLYKIADRYIIDPTILEELCSQVTLTVGVNGSGSVCSIQKGGNGSIEPSLLTEMIQVKYIGYKKIYMINIHLLLDCNYFSKAYAATIGC